MLIIATSLRQLRFGELMEVYADSNEEKASEWPNLPRGYALTLAEQDFRQYLNEVFFRTPGALCALWEESGKYVSALRLEPYRDGLLLEALETAPFRRRKGYAVTLIREVQGYLARQGPVRIYSHIHKRNAYSQRTHEKCGFRMISDRAVYIDGSVDCRCDTWRYEEF